jgi:hypothetical protein
MATKKKGIEGKKVVEPSQAAGAECGFKKKRMAAPGDTKEKATKGGY